MYKFSGIYCVLYGYKFMIVKKKKLNIIDHKQASTTGFSDFTFLFLSRLLASCICLVMLNLFITSVINQFFYKIS